MSKSLSDALLASNKGAQNFTLRIQDYEVCVSPHRENAFLRNLRDSRRILARCRDRLPQIPFSKTRQIADGNVHGQNASRQLPLCHALAITNLDCK
jgi:hypothetical protein